MQIKKRQFNNDLSLAVISSIQLKLTLVGLFSLLLACNNSKSSKLEYYQDGSTKSSSEIIDDSIILIREFHSNQVIKNVRTIVNGKRKGISQSFNPQGVKIAQTKWLNDKQHGLSVYYFSSGRMSKTVNFVSGLRLGEYKEYYDIKGSQTRLSANYIVVAKREHLNEYFKYNQAGRLIDRSPIIRASYKTDYIDCISHVALRVVNPSFPYLEVTTGNYDQDYNLRSMGNLQMITTMSDSTNINIKLVGVNDTIVYGAPQ